MPSADDSSAGRRFNSRDVSLRDYLIGIIDEREKKYHEKYECLEEALANFEKVIVVRFDTINEQRIQLASAMEHRLNLLNEFRAQSVQEGQSYARRSEVDITISNIERRLNELHSRIDHASGKEAGISATWALVGFAITGIIGILGVVIAFVRSSP